MRAGIIFDQRLATYSPERMLTRIFGNVTRIKSSELNKQTIKQYDSIFFPGVQGEKSICDELLVPDQRKLIIDEVREHGLSIWLDCSWPYRGSQHTTYTFSDGHTEQWEGWKWYSAITEGPALSQAIASNPNNRFHDMQMADVLFHAPDRTIELQVCNANGPGLIVKKDNPEIKIIAEYKGLKKEYVAALSEKVGRGNVLAQGILPQITADHAVAKLIDPTQEQHRAHIESRLRHHHDDIIHLQDQLASEIKPYMELRHAKFA